MSAQVPISISLCNRTYRVKVASENEATVRKTIHAINEKITELKKNFPGRDDHDYMAMTLIDYLTSTQDTVATSSHNDEEILQKLEAINNLFDE